MFDDEHSRPRISSPIISTFSGRRCETRLSLNDTPLVIETISHPDDGLDDFGEYEIPLGDAGAWDVIRPLLEMEFRMMLQHPFDDRALYQRPSSE